MKPMFEKIPQKNSTREMIMNQFTKMIKKGELEIGDKIPPERNLAEQFGVGRSTIREAIKSMTSMGLLEARLGEGTFVRKVDSGPLSRNQTQRIWILIEFLYRFVLSFERLALLWNYQG